MGERRYANEEQRRELVELFHTAHTALAGQDDSRYARMLWAVRAFVKAHPDWSQPSVYKEIDRALRQGRIIGFMPAMF